MCNLLISRFIFLLLMHLKEGECVFSTMSPSKVVLISQAKKSHIEKGMSNWSPYIDLDNPQPINQLLGLSQAQDFFTWYQSQTHPILCSLMLGPHVILSMLQLTKSGRVNKSHIVKGMSKQSPYMDLDNLQSMSQQLEVNKS